MLICCLSPSDLVCSSIQILHCHRRFNHHTWIFGQAFCAMAGFSPYAMIRSIFVIALIALERHRTIIYPFKLTLNKKRVIRWVCFLWFVAIGILSPSFYLMDMINVAGKKDCARSWNNAIARYWDLIAFILTYPIPLVAILLCYFCVILNVTQNQISKAFWSKKPRNGHFIKARVIFRRKYLQHRKLIIVIGSIILTFVITQTPNHVHILRVAFLPKAIHQQTLLVLYSLSTLVHLQSFINPLIYCIVDSKYHKSNNSDCVKNALI